MDIESNPVFKKLCESGQLSVWTKKGIRLYPDSLFSDDCTVALREKGERADCNCWYFDGETGGLIIENEKELTLSVDDFKTVIKSVVINWMNK